MTGLIVNNYRNCMVTYCIMSMRVNTIVPKLSLAFSCQQLTLQCVECLHWMELVVNNT